MRRLTGTLVLTAMVLAACGSGPSPQVRAANRLPSTTTTTEPPPEGVFTVKISNGRFSPSNVDIDLSEFQIVRWENDDPPREYQIISNPAGTFESPVIAPGESWEFDFSTIDPDIYRYNTFLGMQRIPGLIDTRPSR